MQKGFNYLGNNSRPALKQFPLSKTSTLFMKPSFDETRLAPNPGLFNDMYRKRLDDTQWKPSSKQVPHYHQVIEKRREKENKLRRVNATARDPIVQGEGFVDEKVPRTRFAREASPELQVFNEKRSPFVKLNPKLSEETKKYEYVNDGNTVYSI